MVRLVHALETLLVPERGPESDHLLLTASYKRKLLDSFRSVLTQTRETHVKGLEEALSQTSALVPPPEVDIYPLLPVEPLATFYLRTARAYRFLEAYLLAALGEPLLASRGRLDEQMIPSEVSLLDELRALTRVVYGLYVVSSRAVGLDPEAHLLPEEMEAFPVEESAAAAAEWLAGWRDDGDVLADARVMVPIAVNDWPREVIYWATVGIRVIRISAEFVPGYEPREIQSSECKVRDIVGQDYYLLVDQMVEVRIPRDRPPLTRHELRSLCDQYETVEEIVTALTAP